MTFKEIIQEKKNAYYLLRDEIRVLLGNISLSTYYLKLEKDGFTPSEKKSISDHLNMPVDELFPKMNKNIE